MNLGRDFGVLEDFHSPPGIVHPPLLSPGNMWGWGSEQKPTIQKVKVLVKQIKALSIFHAVLRFELYVSVTLEHISRDMVETMEGESTPRTSVSVWGDAAETQYIIPLEQQPPEVYTVSLQVEPPKTE